jgi:serine/threonine protein kinase
MPSAFPAALTARYRPERPLGEGAFGQVWLATELRFDRRVAIKLLSAAHAGDEGEVARFLDEAKITAALAHPHVVKVLDFGSDDGRPWIAYELLEGRTLQALIDAGPVPVPYALALAAQAARALHAAHQAGVLHRDVKPENLFEVGGEVKVTDFGIARWSESSRVKTATGVVVGSPAYLAPELVQERPSSAASDVYALGVTLYQLLTGKLPFEEPGLLKLLEQHARAPVPKASARRADVSPAVDAIVARAMGKTQRYASAAAMADALDAAAGVPGAMAPEPRSRPSRRERTSDEVTKRAARPGPAPQDPTRRGSGRATGAALAMVAALALGVFFAREEPAPAPSPSPAPPSAPASTPSPHPSDGPTLRTLLLSRGSSEGLFTADLTAAAPLQGELREAVSRAVVARIAEPAGRHHRVRLPLRPDHSYELDVRPAGSPWGVTRYRFRSREKDWPRKFLWMLDETARAGRSLTELLEERSWGYADEQLVAGRVAELARKKLGGRTYATAVILAISWTSQPLYDVLVPLEPPEYREFNARHLAVIAARLGLSSAPELLQRCPPTRQEMDQSPEGIYDFLETLEDFHPPAGARREVARWATILMPPPDPRPAQLLARLEMRSTLLEWWAAHRGEPRRSRSARLALLALLALAETGDDADVAVLADAARSPDHPHVAKTALAALGRVRSSAATTALRAALRSPHAADAAWALSRVGDPSAGGDLLPLLDPTRAVTVRVAAACALGSAGHAAARPRLESGLEEENFEVRRACAWALGRLRDKSSLAALSAFAGSERDADGVGLWALGEVAGRDGAPDLIDRMKRLTGAVAPRGEDLRSGVALLAAWLQHRELAHAHAKSKPPRASPFHQQVADLLIKFHSAQHVRVVFPFVHFQRTGLIARPGDVLDLRARPALREGGPEGGWESRPAKSDLPGVFHVEPMPALCDPLIAWPEAEPLHQLATRGGEIVLSPYRTMGLVHAGELPLGYLGGLSIVRLERLTSSDVASPSGGW